MIPEEAKHVIDTMKSSLELWEWVYNTNHIPLLSGHGLEQHIGQLAVEGLLRFGQEILCIGVGNGTWIRDLVQFLQHKSTVSVMDICDAAVRSVSDVATPVKQESLPANRFDLCLSFWVTPHMTNAELSAHIRAILPALSDNGTLALHFLTPIGSYDEADFIAWHRNKAWAVTSGALARTQSELEKMVNEAGGRIVCFPWENVVDALPNRHQFTAHIRRNA